MQFNEKQAKAIWKQVKAEFNWAKVHMAMEAVDWCWYDFDTAPKVPSVKEMKKTVKGLVILALMDSQPGESFSTGGFHVKRKHRGVILSFRLDHVRCETGDC